MAKVLSTGSTGLIGKEAVPRLLDKGYEVFAVSRNKISSEEVHYLQGSVFDEDFVKSVFRDVKPEFLLNFAWITAENYLLSPENYMFENAGFEILKEFALNGGN